MLLDITTSESRVDLVAEGYDAGIHYGEYIEQDMVPVRVSPDHLSRQDCSLTMS